MKTKYKIKKSHKWETIEISEVEVQCPYCHKTVIESDYGEYEEGRIITCNHCKKVFELGVAK